MDYLFKIFLILYILELSMIQSIELENDVRITNTINKIVALNSSNIISSPLEKDDSIQIHQTLEIVNPKDNQLEIMMKQVEKFSCNGKPGYYTDKKYNCRIYHLCQRVSLKNYSSALQKTSSLCPQGTAFDLQSLKCKNSNEVKCKDQGYRRLKKSNRQSRQLLFNYRMSSPSFYSSPTVYYMPDPVPLRCYTCCKDEKPIKKEDNFWVINYPKPSNPQPQRPGVTRPTSRPTPRPTIRTTTRPTRPPTSTTPWWYPTSKPKPPSTTPFYGDNNSWTINYGPSEQDLDLSDIEIIDAIFRRRKFY